MVAAVGVEQPVELGGGHPHEGVVGFGPALTHMVEDISPVLIKLFKLFG
jgi:hypothetical protein